MTEISKTGVVKTNAVSESIINVFDPIAYAEPDGSVWIRIVHHNKPSTARFASNNTFTSQVYLDEDRWFNASLCNLANKWEMMVKQMPTAGGTETKYRWIQSTNPMGGTYEDVAPSAITRITTSGYANVTSYGGAYAFNSNTYLVCANNTKGNWFGAFGCWNVWNEGLPGYAGSAVTTGYMDLYLRIDNLDSITKTSIFNTAITSREFLEI